MNYWRMAFRVGSQGDEMWEDCRKRGIAAIGYYAGHGEPIVGDCSKLTEGEYNEIWRRKYPENTTGRASLRNVAYRMKMGDVIYVKQGPYIVGRGRVTSEYQYDPDILKGTASEWEHFVRVNWETDFHPMRILLGAELTTVLQLSGERLQKLNAVIPSPREESSTKTTGGTKTRSNTRTTGAGFGTPEINRKVERAAISFVTKHYKSQGWSVKSVEANKRGFDLLCMKDSIEEHVEVKGIQRRVASFIITAGEVQQAKTDKSFALCVVTSAISKHPRLSRYSAEDFIKRFDLVPLAFRASLHA